MALFRPRVTPARLLRVLALCLPLGVSACSLDHEEEVRAQLQDWVKLGETYYFHSRVNCTAALFAIKATRISSMVKKVRDVESGMRAISEGRAVAFEIANTSPTAVTEQIMSQDLPMGLGVLSSGTSGKDCMAVEMEEAYFNALLDPTSVLLYAPERRFMAIFDRRNKRMFYSRGRSS
nr:hypothetical protein [Phaeobacter sp. HF9A]